jgi:hypothetical protein
MTSGTLLTPPLYLGLLFLYTLASTVQDSATDVAVFPASEIVV